MINGIRLTDKQLEVFKYSIEHEPNILILAGGKRAGKTFVLNLLYLLHIAKFKGQGLNFIIGGSTQASIRRNILNDLETILQKELKIKKDSSVDIFGNKVYILEGSKSDSYKRARGFSSAGFLCNEATTLHDKYIKECISRCSVHGSKIFMDCNPEGPLSVVKTDYIDKDGQLLDDGRVNIKYFHFTLFDNNFLSKDYVDSICKSTPSGVYYDRDILGLWVNAEGLIYDMWDKDENTIEYEDFKGIQIEKYWMAQDFGYSHYGALGVFGRGVDGTVYLIEEYAYTHKNMDDFWVPLSQKLKEKYGNVLMYCDSARPEHIDRLCQFGIKAINAEKAVVAGISHMASLIHTRKFKVVKNVPGTTNRFDTEVNLYCWDTGGKDQPVKTNDDVMDMCRYGLYTEHVLYSGRKEREYRSR